MTTTTPVPVRRGMRNAFRDLRAILQRWKCWCAETTGIRRALLAMAFGSVAVLALPPLHIIPALVPAFVGLVWLLESRRTWRGALWIGWCFGFGYFCAGLYWVANALLTKPEEFGALVPLAVGGLSALLALFVAVAGGLAGLTRARGVPLVLALAGGWAIAEWLRSFVLTGFPWNLVATVWTISDSMLQSTAAVGPYGLGLITVAAAAMPAVLASGEQRTRFAVPAVIAVYACLALAGAGGALRLNIAGPVEFVDGVHLRLVQPNIPQTQKWVAGLRIGHVFDQIRLGSAPGSVQPTHIIWSEVAAPLILDDHPELLSAIGAGTPQGALTLLGALRRTREPDGVRMWNSLWVIDSGGRAIETYDKSHLVPFGEYVPFRDIIDIGSVAGGLVDFTPGPGRRTLRLPGTPALSPLVCYEVIFPGAVTDGADRPQWIVNITNDAWYGYSAGPFQHFAAARLRAVEEGLPLVRVANTGISGIIDPYGRVVDQLGLEVRGVVDGRLPQAIPEKTLYARYGGAITLVLAVGLVAWPLAGRRSVVV